MDEQITSPWIQFGLVLLGAFCATAGGVVAKWYEIRKTRRRRFEELFGERMMEIWPKALREFEHLSSIFLQATPEDCYKFMEDKNGWFWDNRPFLPAKVFNKWLSVSSSLRRVVRRNAHEEVDENKRLQVIAEINNLEKFIDTQIDEVKRIIEKKLKVKSVKLEKPPKKQ